MRVLHAGNVVGDERNLAIALRESGADVAVFTGNMIDLNECITPEQAQMADAAVQFMKKCLRSSRPAPFRDGLKFLMGTEGPRFGELKKAAETYSTVEALFDEKAVRQYGAMRRVVNEFPGQVIVARGMWDSTSLTDEFSQQRLHGEVKTIEDVEFCGISGGKSHPAIPFGRRYTGTTLDSAKFLMAKQPDVVVGHFAPLFHLDFAKTGGEDKGKMVNGGDPHLYAAMAACGADLWLFSPSAHGVGAGKSAVWNNGRGLFYSNAGVLAGNHVNGVDGTYNVIELANKERGAEENLVQTITPYVIRHVEVPVEGGREGEVKIETKVEMNERAFMETVRGYVGE
ncbi:MAG: hypothetical protein ABH864_05875 [archaeon]